MYTPYYKAIAIAIANPFDANPVVSTAASCQADPVYTRSTLFVVLKYKSPAVKASPSLSTVGSLAFAPKYVSSKLSAAASAAA